VGRGMPTSLPNLCLSQTGLSLSVLGAERCRVPTSTVDGLCGSLQVAQLGRCGQRCRFGNDAKVAPVGRVRTPHASDGCIEARNIDLNLVMIGE